MGIYDGEEFMSILVFIAALIMMVICQLEPRDNLKNYRPKNKPPKDNLKNCRYAWTKSKTDE